MAGLTKPYGQRNYIGEFSSAANCLTEIKARKWDSSFDGNGTAIAGQMFFDTTVKRMAVWDGAFWLYQAPKINAASGVPTKDTDVDLGYVPGSQWFSTDGFRHYVMFVNGDGLGAWAQTNICSISGATTSAKHFWAQTTAPTINDDLDVGAAEGSHWFDTTNKRVFSCLSNGNGAADWQCLGPITRFIPVTYTDTNASTGYGRVKSVAGGSTNIQLGQLFFPQNVKLQKIYLVGVPNGTTNGTGTVTVATSFGTDGESATTHTDSVSFANFLRTSGLFTWLDITDAFTGIGADDVVGVQVSHSPTIGNPMEYYGFICRFS